MATNSRKIKEQLREFALSLPGAVEDFPWGDQVVKVNKKIFVFLGHKQDDEPRVYLTVKLPESGFAALEMPNAQPTGYGLGKAGWVSLQFEPAECPPAEYLTRWIEESYRSIAPKKLAAQIAAEPAPATNAKPKASSKSKPTPKSAAKPAVNAKTPSKPKPKAAATRTGTKRKA